MPKPIDGRSTGFVVGKLSHLSREETFLFVANYIHIVYAVGPHLGLNSFWIQLRLDWSDGNVGSISMMIGGYFGKGNRYHDLVMGHCYLAAF